ncbi:hypothetical protein B0H16DRAFT_1886492 [Mycena metata]|uniref:Uncharacterized protein n=1 Tax=Mycena metata TaxID=1033252 RepID=A0AAD7J181_9AGAR|nr:hypothetical protein B0H16DRAFT_1886492 [Mycena metata]
MFVVHGIEGLVLLVFFTVYLAITLARHRALNISGKKNTTKRCDSCPLGSNSISSGDFQLVPVKKARPVSSSNTTTGDKEKNKTKGSGIREQAERETMREFYAPIPSLQRVDDYPPLTRKYSIHRKAYASHYTSTWSSFKRKLATLQGRSQRHLSVGIESRNEDPQRTAQAPVRILAELISTRVYEMRTQLNAGKAPAATVTDHRTPLHFLSASAARFRAPSCFFKQTSFSEDTDCRVSSLTSTPGATMGCMRHIRHGHDFVFPLGAYAPPPHP